MSVSNHFISINWNKIKDLPPTDDEFWGISNEAKDNNEEWLKDVPFGEEGQIFKYFTGLMDFQEWFQEARDSMDPKVVASFSSVFTDVGILYDDEAYAPRPIKKDVEFEWVTGAIPPADILEILDRIAKLDIDETQKAFDAANEENPCDFFEDGVSVVSWIKALEIGLKAVAEDTHGMLLVVG
ncbi:MAG: hypothetical protein ABI162_03390 [Luteolibacter sp.]